MFISLESKYPSLSNYFRLPFFGGVMFIVVTLIPSWLVAFGIQKIFQLNDGVQQAIYLIIAGFFHLTLWKYEIKLRVMYIPLWAFLLIGSVVQLFILFTGSKIKL